MTEEAAPSRWLGGASTLVALVSALVALALSLGSTIYTFWPGLTPDPKTKVGATLAALAMDRNVSYGDFLLRVPLRGAGGARPAQEGNVFYLRAKVEGFKREQLRVRWFTYESHNQTRLARLGSTAPLEEIFRPQAPVNEQIAQVWVPAPGQTGDYFVRFELYTGGNVLLSYVDSRPFHIEQA